MLPDRVSNPGPLTYESGALPIALRGPAYVCKATLPKVGVCFDVEGSRSLVTVRNTV